eukprot:TRINITY_DN1715_c0_g1_i1.p1 TRINITY_DN1715_c0_g1~~TRINITY_DN1715_c0_g1_i1.p1  ORF type:complete len:903 (-),score=209.75 TRINITY_DN1715_c0_g1_i1:289-2997(-)
MGCGASKNSKAVHSQSMRRKSTYEMHPKNEDPPTMTRTKGGMVVFFEMVDLKQREFEKITVPAITIINRLCSEFNCQYVKMLEKNGSFLIFGGEHLPPYDVAKNVGSLCLNMVRELKALAAGHSVTLSCRVAVTIGEVTLLEIGGILHDLWGDAVRSALAMFDPKADMRDGIYIQDELYPLLRGEYIVSRGPIVCEKGLPLFSTFIVEGEASMNVGKFLQYFEETNFPPETASHVNSWEFDSWRNTVDENIYYLEFMFDELGFLDEFKVPRDKFHNFLLMLWKHYKKPKYHTFFHAVDVAHEIYMYIKVGDVLSRLSNLNGFALMVSAICHDIGHPGLNNVFQRNALTELALLYNDQSVLENHHTTQAFDIMFRPGCDFLCNLSTDEFKEMRKGIISAILSTDMEKHSDYVKHLESLTPESKVEQSFIMAIILKAADISNVSKTFQLAAKWAVRISHEFASQGDEEVVRKLMISPMCDRRTQAPLGKMQTGFINFVCLPFFKHIVSRLYPKMTHLTDTCMENMKLWTQEEYDGLKADVFEFTHLPEEVATMMRYYKHGVVLKEHSSDGKLFPVTFTGKDALAWILEYTTATKEESALKICQTLVDAWSIVEVENSLPTFGVDKVYCFREHDHIVEMNLGTPKPLEGSAYDVSVQMATSARGLWKSIGSGETDLRAAQSLEGFQTLVSLASSLPDVDLRSLRDNEKAPFWINVFNALCVHIAIVHGGPAHYGHRRVFFRKYAYKIGEHRFSPTDIEMGILRSNEKCIITPHTVFEKLDSRRIFSLPEPIKQVCVCLLRCAESSPAFRVFHAQSFAAEVRSCMKDYCIEHVKVDIDSREICIPRLFKWYTLDFGDNSSHVLKAVAAGVEKDQSDAIANMVVSDEKYTVLFNDFKWGFEAKIASD